MGTSPYFLISSKKGQSSRTRRNFHHGSCRDSLIKIRSSEITEPARKMIREIVDREKSPSPIRVTMAGGCIGPHLGMLFDSARRNDETFEVEGVFYVIDMELLFCFRPITVDYINNASEGKFNITSPHHYTEP